MNVDFLIVGAGIAGLAVARELLRRDPIASVLILEKETSVGKHGSGRNSGVLHSGIYYPPESLKAKFCAEGSKMMKGFLPDTRIATGHDRQGHSPCLCKG